MLKRYISVLFCAVLLAGCAASSVEKAPVETVQPSPAVTAEPAREVIIAVEATPMPEKATPTPTPSPSPTPSPTPEPTPEPDPYMEGVEKTVLREGFYHVPLNDAVKARITGLSYPKDVKSCRTSYEELRFLRILYVDFDGNDAVGELIVNAKLADEVLQIFAELYDARYQLCSVRLVDDYGEAADDNLSMAADNTSSFCYRHVSGSKKLSRHSYGAAIDINPLENPYVKKNGKVSPPAGKAYVNRKKDFAHKIDENDLCYQVFTKYGWEWGGHFKTEKDYQHFSKEVK